MRPKNRRERLRSHLTASHPSNQVTNQALPLREKRNQSLKPGSRRSLREERSALRTDPWKIPMKLRRILATGTGLACLALLSPAAEADRICTKECVDLVCTERCVDGTEGRGGRRDLRDDQNIGRKGRNVIIEERVPPRDDRLEKHRQFRVLKTDSSPARLHGAGSRRRNHPVDVAMICRLPAQWARVCCG